MFCNQCGNQISGKVKFCPKCGNPVLAEEVPPVQGGTPLYPEETPYEPYGNAPDYQAEMPEEPLPETGGRKGSIGSRIGSVFLSILLCVTLLVSGVIGIVRSACNEEKLRELYGDVELSEIELENASGKTVTLSEFILEQCDEDMVKLVGITEDEIGTLLDKSKVQSLALDVLTEYSRYFLEGEEFEIAEVIVDWMEDNSGLLLDVMNLLLGENDLDELEDTLEDVLYDYTPEGLSESLGFDIGIFTVLLSVWFYVVMLVLSAVLAVGILLLNRKRIVSAFACIGVVGIVDGCIFLLAILAAVAGKIMIGNELASILLSAGMALLALWGGVSLAVGILITLIVRLIKKRTV